MGIISEARELVVLWKEHNKILIGIGIVILGIVAYCIIPFFQSYFSEKGKMTAGVSQKDKRNIEGVDTVKSISNKQSEQKHLVEDIKKRVMLPTAPSNNKIDILIKCNNIFQKDAQDICDVISADNYNIKHKYINSYKKQRKLESILIYYKSAGIQKVANVIRGNLVKAGYDNNIVRTEMNLDIRDPIEIWIE